MTDDTTTEIVLHRGVDSWAEILKPVGVLANSVADTEFVPQSLRKKPAAIAACILAGRELGIGPMQSLQSIYVVSGRPTLSAELMRALVLSAGHSLVFTSMTSDKVVVKGTRKGEAEGTTVEYSMADATRAGLTGKATWKAHPRNMLAARATSELCRLVFADALGGISYTPDEVEDLDSEPVVVKRKRTPKPVPEVEAPELPEVVDAEVIEGGDDA